MPRRLLAAVALAAGLAAAPASAQQSTPPAQVEVELVGLPVFSSDGHKLGEVTQVGMSAAGPAVQAQIGGFLGLGPSTVVIPAASFERKPDRIELPMTAEDVKDRVSRQKQ